MEAFEAFLKFFPEWQGKVVMIQVTEPTPNESPKMSTKISRYVDHINVRFIIVSDTHRKKANIMFPSGHVRRSLLRTSTPLSSICGPRCKLLSETLTSRKNRPDFLHVQEYLALLSVADLALVTSMRDGMNTTSMEYVLCQQKKKSPLILSEFTGVTGSMKEAVRVNPWDSNGVARAIDACLQMSTEEKERRFSVSAVVHVLSYDLS